MNIKTKLIHINSEIGAGTRGASKGILGMLRAAYTKGSMLFNESESEVIPHANSVQEDPIKYQFSKRVTSLLPVFNAVSKSIEVVLRKGKQFPIVLAGDHSTAVGTIAGIKGAFPNKKIGVIWIDAHADIHTPYTTPSGNMHGMPIAASLGIDNKLKARNSPHDVVISTWGKIKNLSIPEAKILPEDLVYIGVRDVEQEEADLISKYKVKNFTVDTVREIGVEKTVRETFALLTDVDLIYVSYDVDVLDPSQSRGTGTPVEHGFLIEEIKEMIKLIISEPKVKCFEMVEINPDLDDKGNRMAEMAFEVLEIVVAEKS